MSDQSLTEVDVRSQHAIVHGKAAGRTVDILKLDAIFDNPLYPDVETDFSFVPKTVGVNTGLDAEKMVKIRSKLNSFAVPTTQRQLMFNSDQTPTAFLDQLVNDSRISDQFPMNTGRLPNYLGMGLVELPDQSTNSIPVTAVGSPVTSYTSYAACVHYASMKMEYNVPITTDVVVDAPNRNFVIVTELVCNAQILQKDGIGIIGLELDTDGDPINN